MRTKLLVLLSLLLVAVMLFSSCDLFEREDPATPADEQTAGDQTTESTNGNGEEPTDEPTQGDVTDPQGEDPEPHEHAWDEGVETTPATLTQEGVKTFTCTVCGETKTEAIPVIGSNMSDGTGGGGGGSSGGSSSTPPTPTHTHTWNEGVVTTAATCETAGVKTYTCTGCNETKTEAIPATGHTYQNGVCTVCGTEQEVSKGLAFTSNGDGTCYVSGIGTCTDSDVVIPSKSPAGDTVTSIGEYAFDGVTNLCIISPILTAGRDNTDFTNWTEAEQTAFWATIDQALVDFAQSIVDYCLEKYINYAEKYIGATSEEVLADPALQIKLGMYLWNFGSYWTEGATIKDYAAALEDYYQGDYVELSNVEKATESFWYFAKMENPFSSITIPASVTSIGNGAFFQCTSLTSITIPASVTSIGGGAFYGCSALTSVTIPASVTSIGMHAFYWCRNLISITIPASVTSIGGSAFSYCTSLTSMTVAEGNPVYHSAGNCIIETASKTLVAGCKNSVIPTDGSVTSIGEDAFSQCTSLTSITIPASVTSIGWNAFFQCTSLTSVTIPASVTSIRGSAFQGCSGLTSMTVTEGNPVYHSAGNCIIETASGTLVAGCKNSVIPTDGSVTSIGNAAFSDCTSLTSITIPASVTSIGNAAFSDCTSLTSITFAEDSQLKSIEGYAFYGCSALTSVTIPASVTSIGWEAFSGCTSLTSMTVAEGNPVYHSAGNCIIETASKTLVAGCKNSVIPTDGSVTSIGERAFGWCESLTSITIPASVTSIGKEAFYVCKNLTSITIPASVTSIGGGAFDWCKSLTNITFLGTEAQWNAISKENDWDDNTGDYTVTFAPADPTPEDPAAYSEGLKFTSNGDGTCYVSGIGTCTDSDVVIPSKSPAGDTVTRIGVQAFYHCTSLTSITIPASVTSIGERAFGWCESLTSMTVAEGNPVYHSAGNCMIETASKTLVAGCKNSVIPTDGSVTSIGDQAFEVCSSLTSITIPDSVTSIGNFAFSDCTSLTSVSIPASVTSIGEAAFFDCYKLTSVTIPDSVTSIGSHAFSNCYKLTSVYITDLANWCGIAFGNAHANPLYYAHNLYLNGQLVTDLVIPDSVTSIGEWAFFGCSSLTGLTVADGNPVYHSAGNCIIETASGTLVAGCKNSVIPTDGSVTSIGSYAFKNCTSLTELTIPDSVTSIGEGAFYWCTSLTSITIPASVTRIGGYAFYGCSNLQYNTYGNANYLGNANNPYHALIKVTGTSITSCTIHPDTKVIADLAFSDCWGLTSITIPASVTSIGWNAFFQCTSLTNITFLGTEAEWNAISKGSRWDNGTGNYTIHCTDGDIVK